MRGNPWIGDQRLYAAETRRMHGDRQRLEEALGGPDPTLQLDTDHPAEATQNAFRELVIGMRSQTRVMDLRDGVLFSAPLGHCESDFVVTAYADRERAHAAVGQPGGEGIDGLSPDLQQPPNFFD